MEEYSAEKKCAAVPPILVHTPGPSPPSNSGVSCILPPLSPRGSVLNGGYHWSLDKMHDQAGSVKTEQVNSCMLNSSSQACSKNPPTGMRFANLPTRLPLASSGANMQHLQHLNVYATTSPLAHSEVSPTHHSVRSNQARLLSVNDSVKPGKIKTEVQPGVQRLPPLNNYHPGSNLDIDDTLSPLIPPINSVSPYIGSGISEIPSFPSILASPTHLSRKRALSTSPLSDMLDVYALRSSPNSLMAALCNNPVTPSGSVPISHSAIGHLIGQSNSSLQAMQYRVQQRKTSIEHNQNDDGTTNTTITNQITISKNPHRAKYVSSGTQGDEPMELDATGMDEDFVDPHICLWEGCGLNFNDLEDLVQHIENSHIEKGKADEYVCLWKSCIRDRKPFNARYKLLIHMRIHSGEKPNKCTVS